MNGVVVDMRYRDFATVDATKTLLREEMQQYKRIGVPSSHEEEPGASCPLNSLPITSIMGGRQRSER